MLHSSSFQSLTDQATNPSSQSQPVGYLEEKDVSGKVVNIIRLFADQEVIIGRDGNRCQYVLDDPVTSNKHLRIYSVVYDNDKPDEFSPLVYAEDLSRNGTFWNSSVIGKGNGGFLLSDRDTLRVSARILFVYRMIHPRERDESFDFVQEHEMKVGILPDAGNYVKAWKHFYKDYIVTDRVLGAGAYGRVHMAIEQSQRTQLACKVVDLRKLQPPSRMRFGRWEQPAAAEDVDSRLQLVKVKSWGQRQKRDNKLEEKLKTCYREAEILASLSHPNIIGLEKVYLTDNSIYIFQDLVTAGDLFSFIELKNGKLLEVEAAVIVRQILVALDFLHKDNIVHRDLKPENILMTTLASGCRVVLTDFGCARRLDHQRKRMLTSMGTYEYIAPEMPHDQNSKTNTSGYTKAVDLWSLGCVTVVLLTGGYPFFEPGSSDYSESLASTCNLDGLEKSQVWRDVGDRPKSFVRRLLVLDERLRMTATESLTHEWFTNDIHRTDFEELYQRAIRHWRPRKAKEPIIELIDAENLKSFPFLQGISHDSLKSRRRGPLPVDPPYKPFPRRLHNQAFFPKRRTSPFDNVMSEDVKAAIKSNWNFDKSHSTESSMAEDELPIPCAREVGKESGDSSNGELRDGTLLPSPTSVPALSRKPRFQPFRSKYLLTGTDTTKASGKNSEESKYRDNESNSTICDEPDMASVQRTHNSTAWEKEAEAVKPPPNGKAKLTLPNRPATQRAVRTLVESNNNTDLSLSPMKSPSTLRSRRFFEQAPQEAVRQLDQHVVGRDDKTHLSDRHGVRHSSIAASTNQQKHTYTWIHSLSEATHDETSLNFEPNVGMEYSHSLAGALPAVSAHEDARVGALKPVTAAAIGFRLKSPTHAIGDILGTRSSNTRKRRNHSIYDFEEDAKGSALGKGKKARFDHENVRRTANPTLINAAFPQTKSRPENIAPTVTEVEKTLGQTYRADDLYLPRI